jgi:TPP-dependent indolepyruvate ferredoxin oxidoreductase alpha subunit
VLVFKATLGTGMAADPFLQFEVQTPRSGELVLVWSDDSGEKGQARAQIEVKT